jgi:protein-S-isoprenylcysteine O-methyltransferase Ste14
MKNDMKFRFIIWGERLFQMRSYTPIPLFLFMFVCSWGQWENDMMVWFFGLFFVACGEGLRLWSLRYIGRFSRTTRKRKGSMLVMGGPYTLMRNPLYCGNLLILIGVTILSQLLWFIPIVIILFSLQYYCIVLWEEETLLKNFPRDAELYFRSVPRWLPTWQTMGTCLRKNMTPDYPWLDVFRREQSTLLGLFTMATFMMIKELFLDTFV